MKLIAITTPNFFEGESLILTALFQEGMERVHLRKPQGDKQVLRLLLDTVPEVFHSRIVLHDHFELTSEYNLAGIHLNSRNHIIPEGFKGSISRSCHSLQEVKENRQLDYVFLSPVFESISKEGYGSGFSLETLQDAASHKIINEKVIALGGISNETIPSIRSIGFGGVAVLGALWGKVPDISQKETIINQYKNIQLCLKR